MKKTTTVRIGGGSAFWGDSAIGPVQLVKKGELNYLVLEYLAELTMSLLVRAKAKDPELGYATDFVTGAMRSTLKDIAAKRIRVITNAGGVNPSGCAQALAQLADELGVHVKIAIVDGDDLLPRIATLRRAGIQEMSTHDALPPVITSANAYLGAFPIARALDAGADIVITGRCVDSALTLGPLIHEFGWTDHAYDLLAAGSLAGHILECGTQATGGIHTDWEDVPDWANIGYPIAECDANGTFVITKAPGTGGLVNRLTVAEQLGYEVGDPSVYLLPDVIADFTEVQLTEIGPDRVRVEGARGRAPTPTLKVSATYADGWRCTATRTIVGAKAAAKAERYSRELIQRCNMLNAENRLAPLSEVCTEILGTEQSSFGPNATTTPPREVVLRIAVKHSDRKALGIFAREVAPFATNGPPGVSGSGVGRSTIQPVLRLYSFLLPKENCQPIVRLPDHTSLEVPFNIVGNAPVSAGKSPVVPPGVSELPAGANTLSTIAVGRSGDKGNTCNIVLIARDPSNLPLLWSKVTPEWIRAHLGHLVQGAIERHALPGIGAMNIVLFDALGGGGMASLRNDPLGKGLAHILLEAPLA